MPVRVALLFLLLPSATILSAGGSAEERPELPSQPELSAEEKARHDAWREVAPPYSIGHALGGTDHAPSGSGI